MSTTITEGRKAIDFKNSSEELKREATHYVKGHITRETFKAKLLEGGFADEEADKVVRAFTF